MISWQIKMLFLQLKLIRKVKDVDVKFHYKNICDNKLSLRFHAKLSSQSVILINLI